MKTRTSIFFALSNTIIRHPLVVVVRNMMEALRWTESARHIFTLIQFTHPFTPSRICPVLPKNNLLKQLRDYCDAIKLHGSGW
jgi:hypothetical protein